MAKALYCRVSTWEQDPTNQLIELRRYAAARGWADAIEFVDHGVSGSLESRPAVDRLVKAAKRRQIDTVVVVALDRFGRNLRHLVTAIDDLAAHGVAFVSLNESIATDTPSGRLQLHILASMAEFERSRIGERTRMGIQKARLAGKRIGRPRQTPLPEHAVAITVRDAARVWGVSRATAARRLSKGILPVETTVSNTADESGVI